MFLVPTAAIKKEGREDIKIYLFAKLIFFFETRSDYVAHAGLELKIFLSQLPGW
jgi:hypothetical protein